MKTVERERLYEQVWATPLTQLCKSYGLSYQGLRKLCVELNVPIPPRGYWARIAAGATFSIPELPTEGQEEKLLPESDASEKKLQAKRIVAASAAASNNHGQEKLHPVVVPIQKKYLEAESEALRSKQRFDWEIANPGKRYPKRGLKNYYESWESFSAQGQILCHTHKKSVLKVSLGTFRRALSLLSGLAHYCDSSGFRPSIPEKTDPLRQEWLEASRDGAKITIRITEKLVVHKRIGKTSWSNTPQELRELSPTGRLAILIGHEGFGETLIVDKPGALLETQWEKIIDAVELQHKTAIETVRAWALQRQRAEESDRVRREEARRREAELLRRQALLQEVRDWEAAQSLRSYLGHLFALRDSGGVVPADFDEWSSWVTSVADSMDSSLRRVRPVEPD